MTYGEFFFMKDGRWLMAKIIKKHKKSEGRDSLKELTGLGFGLSNETDLYYIMFPPEGWTTEREREYFTNIKDQSGEIRIIQLDIQMKYPWGDDYSAIESITA